jgi:tripartite-type tricarboxylate transporter receptor subunit TctC
VVERLNAEIIKALEQPDVRETLGRYGLVPAPMTPEKFGAFIRTEMERNGRIIAKLNLKID